jgi:hypothetical protein
MQVILLITHFSATLNPLSEVQYLLSAEFWYLFVSYDYVFSLYSLVLGCLKP